MPSAMAWCIQPGEEPHLPQRPRAGKRATAERLAGTQHVGVVARGRDGEDPDVIVDVERRGVEPQRPAEAETRHAQDLPEPGHPMQPPPDVLPEGVDPDSAVGVEEPVAVEDGQRADVLGPALVFGPDRHEVGGSQAFDRRGRVAHSE
jgi:hypothetical protein